VRCEYHVVHSHPEKGFNRSPEVECYQLGAQSSRTGRRGALEDVRLGIPRLVTGHSWRAPWRRETASKRIDGHDEVHHTVDVAVKNEGC